MIKSGLMSETSFFPSHYVTVEEKEVLITIYNQTIYHRVSNKWINMTNL